MKCSLKSEVGQESKRFSIEIFIETKMMHLSPSLNDILVNERLFSITGPLVRFTFKAALLFKFANCSNGLSYFRK